MVSVSSEEKLKTRRPKGRERIIIVKIKKHNLASINEFGGVYGRLSGLFKQDEWLKQGGRMLSPHHANFSICEQHHHHQDMSGHCQGSAG